MQDEDLQIEVFKTPCFEYPVIHGTMTVVPD